MKRDIDLLRKILLAIEASADDEASSIRLPVGYDELHLSHHIRLLSEGGLIHAFESCPYNAVSSWVPHSLTWQGYEMLAAIRAEEIWQRVKTCVAAVEGHLPVSVLCELAMRECRDSISRKNCQSAA